MSAERRVWDCVCVFDEAAIEEVQSKKEVCIISKEIQKKNATKIYKKAKKTKQ